MMSPGTELSNIINRKFSPSEKIRMLDGGANAGFFLQHTLEGLPNHCFELIYGIDIEELIGEYIPTTYHSNIKK